MKNFALGPFHYTATKPKRFESLWNLEFGGFYDFDKSIR